MNVLLSMSNILHNYAFAGWVVSELVSGKSVSDYESG